MSEKPFVWDQPDGTSFVEDVRELIHLAQKLPQYKVVAEEINGSLAVTFTPPRNREIVQSEYNEACRQLARFTDLRAKLWKELIEYE